MDKERISDSFQSAPRYEKLMFLLKQTIWNENLELNESDCELLDKVKKLADKFEENGVTDSNSKFFRKSRELH